MSSPHDSRTGAEIDRRAFLHGCGGLATAALATPGLATSGESAVALPAGKAEHCIVLWLGGGASQIDTFDPKHRGDAKMRTPGSDYDAIPTAIAGEKVCEHLRRTPPPSTNSGVTSGHKSTCGESRISPKSVVLKRFWA